MNNDNRLKRVFAEAFSLSPEEVTDALAYQECAAWDSIAHMTLVVSIDAEFGTMLETDDIIDMSSFGMAKQILTKHGISFCESSSAA